MVELQREELSVDVRRNGGWADDVDAGNGTVAHSIFAADSLGISQTKL
jgi:hypothetical protein